MEKTERLHIREAADWLAQRDNILILCHTRPDGDTLGSAFALRAALRQLSKRAYCVCDTRIPDRLAFLTEAVEEEGAGCANQASAASDITLSSLPGDFKWETVVAVDVASPQQLGEYEELFGSPEKTDLAIDHHQTHTYFTRRAVVDSGCAACGEIIYEIVCLLLQTRILPCVAASALYAAVSSDSGSFRYSSVTPQTLRIAASLMESGIDHAAIADRLYGSKTLAEITAARAAYNEMKLLCGGRVAVVTFSAPLMETYGLSDADIEDVVNQLRDIRGVRVAAHLKVRGEGIFKVSVRSAPGIDVSRVCAQFGGGGHPCAAGCTLKGDTPEEAEALFLEALCQTYPELA